MGKIYNSIKHNFVQSHLFESHRPYQIQINPVEILIMCCHGEPPVDIITPVTFVLQFVYYTEAFHRRN